MSDRKLDHSEAREQFSAYRDGDLPKEMSDAVKAHLDGCADCKREYNEFAEAVSSLMGFSAPAPPDFVSSLQGEIRRRSRGRFFVRKPPRFPLELVSLITLMLMVAILLYLRLAAPTKVQEGAPAPPAGAAPK